MPLVCEHGVITPRDGKQSRWLAVMKSALKQCGRSWLPDLAPAQPLAEALASGTNAARYFGAAPYELPAGQIPFWHSLLELPAGAAPDELGFFVGPEGGWSPAELALLSDRAVALSLGPHILRAETAAAAGLTALQVVRQAWLQSASGA